MVFACCKTLSETAALTNMTSKVMSGHVALEVQWKCRIFNSWCSTDDDC